MKKAFRAAIAVIRVTLAVAALGATANAAAQSASCAPPPAEYAEQIALLERVREFGQRIDIWPNEMYRCFTERTGQQRWVLSFHWASKASLAWDRNQNTIGTIFASGTENADGFKFDTVLFRDIGGTAWVNIEAASGLEDFDAFLKHVLQEGFDTYWRWSRVWSSLTDLDNAFLRQSAAEQTELMLHEGTHDAIMRRGLVNIHNDASLEEAVASIWGIRGTMRFFRENKMGTEYDIVRTKYAWMVERAEFVNGLHERLTVLYNSGDIAGAKDLFASAVEEGREYFGYDVTINNASVAYLHTYTALLPYATTVWEERYGEEE